MFALKTLQRQKTGVMVTTATLQRQSCRITKLSSSAPSIIHHQGGGLSRCFTAAAVSNSSAVIGAPLPTITTSTSTKHYGVLSSSLLSVIMNSKGSSSTINNPSLLSNALLTRTVTVTSTVSSIFSELWENGLYLISTLKRRKKAMNKHKLRKRRKKNRMKNKK